jgi:hypothetical protein
MLTSFSPRLLRVQPIRRLPRNLMSVELAQLAGRVLAAAREHKLTLIAAESCTARGLAVSSKPRA